MERTRRGHPLSPRELDEDDVRVRPGRGSRPRTRTRPAHSDAQEGLVIAVDRGRYTCWLDGQATQAMRARELGRKSVVVGDHVSLVGDVSGGPDSLARIVRIADRRTVLRRTADDDDPYERVIVANADQLVIVTALVDPPPRTGFVDRCLVAALDAGVEPLLCLTKTDLAPEGAAKEFQQHWSALDLKVVTTRRDVDPSALSERLTGRMSVLIGHSGVGKSTLVNRLVPSAERATGGVSAVGKGRHTSTSAVALALPAGGWVIDTPGVRSFGLAHVSPASLLAGFEDLAPGADDCPTGCQHRSAEEGCHLDAWVAEGHASPERLASYRRLLESR